MRAFGDFRELVDHITRTDQGGHPVNQKFDPKKIAARAAVTFVQVFLSVLVGTGVLDVSADVAQTALMSGAGAALSVIYNAATQWLAANDG